MRRFIAYGPAFVVLLAALAMLSVTPAVVRRLSVARSVAQVEAARRAIEEDDLLDRLNEAVRNVAAAAAPSVVDISVLLERPRRGRARSSGSGWVYDAEGHIITNAHVVRGEGRIDVQFADGRTYEARVVGTPDAFTDVAVLRIDAHEELIPLPRATGEPVRQGDRVFAFGSPFGFKFSMTEGIVSGTGRDAAAAMAYGGFTNFIQHDAAVNPGNSGGPLVDVKGRVVGMNVAIATGRDTQGTTEGQSAGISFAIPLRTIESVVEQMIRAGEVRRGYLGIVLAPEALVRDVPGFVGAGVMVGGLADGGPSARAGVRVGDIITHINGQPVRSGEVLRALISASRPGERVELVIWREGATIPVAVTLGEFPPEELAAAGGAGALFRYGVADLQDTRFGPMIGEVIPGTAAAEAGFGEGQIVLEVGGVAVATARDVFVQLTEQGILLGRAVPVTVATTDEVEGVQTRTIEVEVLN